MCASGQQADVALADLKAGNPGLYALYESLPQYREQLEGYADLQGFRGPHERLATVIHELVHITSLMHQGYFIDGVYYEPYLAAGAWPDISNKDVQEAMAKYGGLIYNGYVLGAPENRLGNVLDEINAYGHVAGFVCAHDAQAGAKQVENLLGMLRLQEVFLERSRVSGKGYKVLRSPGASRGALLLITQRAVTALKACGVPSEQIPSAEVARLTSGRS